jgi:hypothetical protein
MKSSAIYAQRNTPLPWIGGGGATTASTTNQLFIYLRVLLTLKEFQVVPEEIF